MSYVKVGFASTNLDITGLDGDPLPQNSVRGVGNEEQGERMEECVPRLEQKPIEEIFWEPRRKVKGIRIEERKFGEYECLEIILSLEEEIRISQPWKNGVIVKMLGRQLGLKNWKPDCNNCGLGKA
ncbi:hypothetical protein KIW84_070322 [Lathyrus oleraceus]|uniref:Uncharacterized protein n=1 Tax=Pisum sativum TaxID=3888 RepID=A0A9D4ZUA1_PEA|nr:hypothetical protein KIW84_070322 [Pisum sativum]